MASKKLAKKVYKVRFTFAQKRFYESIGHWFHKFKSYQKVIKKGSKHKGFVRNGLKDVQVISDILLSFLIRDIYETYCFTFSFSSLFRGRQNCFLTSFSYQARIRKGETGLVIFAGDVTPIEVC